LQQIPLLTWKSIIQPNDNKENSFQAESWISLTGSFGKETFALRTTVSLEPRFPAGTLLIIDPELSPSDSNLIIVHFHKAPEATIRQYIFGGQKPLLASINDDTEIVTLANLTRVLGVVRQSRFDF
jgi:SOS-response transcriptional repressor LexA